MKKNRIFAVIIAAVMVVALTACGSSSSSSSSSATSAASSASSAAATSEASAATSEASSEAAATSEATSEAASTTEAAADAIVLRFSAHDPETSAIMQAAAAYFDQIAEVTEGRVVVEGYYSAVLAGVKDVGDMVSSGGVDMGWIYTSYYPTMFTLSDVITLPLQGFGDNVVATNLLWDLYETVPEMAAQWDNEYKVLQLYANPAMIFETNDAITSVDQIKGKNIRVPAGAITDVLAAWGAAGVTMGPPDIYEAMEKGNVDGYIFEEVGSNTFTLYEVTNYYLDMPLFVGAFAIACNWDSWNQISEEDQAAIEAISGREASLVSAEAFHQAVVEAREIAADNGVEFLTPTDEEVAGWKVAADEYAATWCESITESTGLDGEAYLKNAQEIYEKYAAEAE